MLTLNNLSKIKVKAMNIKSLFNAFFAIIIILLVALGAIVVALQKSHKNDYESQDRRFQSWACGIELKMTSDYLTQYCRAYVITKDPSWEEKYNNVLDIRNGKAPRDNGRTISLRDSMSKLQFTNAEFSKLKEAEDLSNKLTYTERVAFNAMKGLYDDGTGNFIIKGKPDSILARKVVFDYKYTSAKYKIMIPIDDFFLLLKKKSHYQVEYFNAQIFKYVTSAIIMIILIGLFSFVSFIKIRKKLVIKIEECNSNNIKILKTEEILKHQNEELDKLNTSKDKFFSIIAHDLRGPVGILMLKYLFCL